MPVYGAGKKFYLPQEISGYEYGWEKAPAFK
jgi:hypothetical protein